MVRVFEEESTLGVSVKGKRGRTTAPSSMMMREVDGPGEAASWEMLMSWRWVCKGVHDRMSVTRQVGRRPGLSG